MYAPELGHRVCVLGHCEPHSLRKTANEICTKQYVVLQTLVGDSHKYILNIGNIGSNVYGESNGNCMHISSSYSQVLGNTTAKGIRKL